MSRYGLRAVTDWEGATDGRAGVRTGDVMFERFTGEARATVVVAQDSARFLGHRHIGTEHVLLGLDGADPASGRVHVLIDAAMALAVRRAASEGMR